MSDNDQMRQEFEAWAESSEFPVSRNGERYDRIETNMVWTAWQAAYAAGRKAEREAMQLKNWDGIRLGTTGKTE